MSDDSEGASESREIVVPLRAYKAVTVFSTLLAIVCVILGFGFLDAATGGAGPLSVLFETIGLADAGGSLFTLVSALVGIGFIALGAGIYVLGTRFRTEGMGKAQDDSGGESDNE
ncbi:MULTISPECIES: DUF7315 family membrane protein [Halococcus]|uniref:DUF7315 domain-containing protein n=2 Tax=Halococcus TaxID=2249 RepID=M0MZ71_9EURY|nr:MULTISPECIES: hypothetical protein [Halococcus]EMA50159.1 hypothetical protein C451_16710 [Halococcus thailandensis JCM 13552]UOO94753.1 hypothetical protein MUK72_12360 [Halococcus dombrowskii]